MKIAPLYHHLAYLCALMCATVSASAANDSPATHPLGLPTLAAPQTPPTPAQIELGRRLFMERRLSPNNTMSCAMCHIPEQGFAANELATAVGINGRTVKRNAPTLLNVAFNQFLFWDGREQSLENLTWQPILNLKEMGNASVGAVLDKLNALTDYAHVFKQAYGGPATRENVAHAIAAYQRTLIAGGTRFDGWFYGKEEGALSTLEQQGFTVFNWFGCAQCHSYDDKSALFTNQRFHNTGIGWAAAQKDKTYTVPLAPGVSTEIRESALENVSEALEPDDGRFEATGIEEERYQYKTPSLRNVALTAPYMHDGSLKTLEEVIEFYNNGGIKNPGRDRLLGKQKMTAQDMKALLAFLRTLTSDAAAALAREARASAAKHPLDR